MRRNLCCPLRGTPYKYRRHDKENCKKQRNRVKDKFPVPQQLHRTQRHQRQQRKGIQPHNIPLEAQRPGTHAVKAAEQLYGSKTGLQKKEYVVAFLLSKGIVFDVDEVTALIESEVYKLTDNGSKAEKV